MSNTRIIMFLFDEKISFPPPLLSPTSEGHGTWAIRRRCSRSSFVSKILRGVNASRSGEQFTVRLPDLKLPRSSDVFGTYMAHSPLQHGFVGPRRFWRRGAVSDCSLFSFFVAWFRRISSPSSCIETEFFFGRKRAVRATVKNGHRRRAWVSQVDWEKNSTSCYFRGSAKYRFLFTTFQE